MKREIHCLLVAEGLSNKEICVRLGIPSRTLDRWLHEIYHEDNLILLSPTIDEVMTSASIYRDRLTKQRRDVLAMANDSTVDAGFRLEAHNLAAEMDKAIYLLSFETPAVVAKNLTGINDRIKKLREWIERNETEDVRLVVNAKALTDNNNKNLELKEEQQQQQEKGS